MNDTSKKYLWCLESGDQQHGLFDSIEAAIMAAMDELPEYEITGPEKVNIFDARPAHELDAALFENADEEEGGCDVGQDGWWKDKWVPENIVHDFIFTPAS